MDDKSYVTLEQRVCIVCGAPYDSGNLLLDKRLRKTFKHKTVTGWGMCPEHQKLADDGFVALVECKNQTANTKLKPEDADRTGQIAHVKLAAFERIFNVPVPKGLVCFVESDVIPALQKMQQAAP